MPISTPVFKPTDVTVDIDNPTSLKITDLVIASANSEVTHVFQTTIKRFTIAATNKAKLQFSTVLGESGTIFKTIKPFNEYNSQDIDFDSKTLYIQSNIAGTTVEIEEWLG